MAEPAGRIGNRPAELDLLSIGEAMVLLLAADGLPLEVADHYRRSIAGAEANVAIGARRLGLRTGWISRVGDDPFGEVIRRALRAEGVHTFVTTDRSRPTGVLIRDMPAVGKVRVQYYRTGSAASGLTESDVRAELISSSRLLHLTGITAMISESACAAITLAQRLAAEAGRVVSFDPNVRTSLGSSQQWAARIATVAAASDIVLAGVDELSSVTGTGAESDAVAELLSSGVGVVVVKDGVRGSRAYTRAGSVEAAALPATAVDAVGAGDAFAAGFLARLLTDHPDLERAQVPVLPALRAALEAGSAVAAAAVSVATDLAGLPFAADPRTLGGNVQGDVER